MNRDSSLERYLLKDKKSVNELLKENGHAYEYHGEKKKGFFGSLDIETLNYLGYGEVFEISLWIALMYIGKGFLLTNFSIGD